MAASDALGRNQFIDVHHLSINPEPPHAVDHPFAAKRAARYKDTSFDDRVHSNDVIFTGTGNTIKDIGPDSDPGGPRRYMHSYRVPMGAMEPTVQGDDDYPQIHLPSSLALKAANVDAPQLFESLPASRKEVSQRGRVQPYRNALEGKGNLSFILPKHHLDSLGVQYLGMTNIDTPEFKAKPEDERYGPNITRHPQET